MNSTNMDSDELLQDYFNDNIEEDILMSSFSSSSSDSETEQHERHHKIENFVDTIRLYSDGDFQKHFRLKRCTAFELIELYKFEKGDKNLIGRSQLPAEKEVYMYLWYMANTVTFRQLGNMFGTGKSTAWRSVNNLAKFLIKISPNYIKWPSSQAEVHKISEGFEALYGIPGIIGAIDGTHIKIKAPSVAAIDYYNRKKYYSIAMQLVVDSEKKIIDVYCGEPGSVHDARMLRRSELFRTAEDSNLSIFPSGTFLLGDSAYPCKSWLVPPFKDNGVLTDVQKRFNILHSSTRVVVENAIGILKSRFRRVLHFADQSNINLIVNLTYSACVLHNMCIMHEDESSQGDSFREESQFFSTHPEVRDKRRALVELLISRNIL